MTRMRTFSALTVAAIALTAPAPGVVSAQDEAASTDAQVQDPREEIERLRARVQELEQELQRAYRRIDSLERRLGIATTTPAEDQDPIVLPEDEPLASIDALQAAASTAYGEEFQEVELDTDVGRRTYLQRLRAFKAQLERDHRGRFVWIADLIDIERLQDGTTYITVVVRDAETGARRSQNQVIEIPRRLVDRLRNVQAGADTTLELKGVLRLALRINPDRVTPGPFNRPPLMGPYLEFGFDLDVQSIAPTTRPEPEPDNPGGEGG